MRNKITCIYRIRNLINGKFYVGSTLDFNSRKTGHRSLLRSGKHYNQYLQRAWSKYGEDAFIFEVFEDLTDIDNQTLRDIEKWWIDNTNCLAPSGYNLSSSAVGYNFTAEHKVNMALAQDRCKEKKSIIQKQRMAVPDNRQVLSDIMKTRWQEKSFRALMTVPPKPAPTAEETKQRRSDAQRKRFSDPDQRQKLSEAHKGQMFSDEHREKLSLARKGKRMSDEAKAIMSIAAFKREEAKRIGV